MTDTEKKKLNEFTDEMADAAIRKLKIDFSKEPFDEDQFRKGIKVEYLEHSDVTDGDSVIAARICIPHLKEIPDYYDRLEKMEKEAKNEAPINEATMAGDVAGLQTNLGTIKRTYPAPIAMGKIKDRWAKKKQTKAVKTFKQFVDEAREWESAKKLFEEIDTEAYKALFNDKTKHDAYAKLQSWWVFEKAKELGKQINEIGRQLSDKFRELYWDKIWKESDQYASRATIYEYLGDKESPSKDVSLDQIRKTLGD